MSLFVDLVGKISLLSKSSSPEDIDDVLTPMTHGVHAQGVGPNILRPSELPRLLVPLRERLGWSEDKLHDEIGKVQIRLGYEAGTEDEDE